MREIRSINRSCSPAGVISRIVRGRSLKAIETFCCLAKNHPTFERSHEAVFDSAQVVTCQTPDGQVDGVFEVSGTAE